MKSLCRGVGTTGLPGAVVAGHAVVRLGTSVLAAAAMLAAAGGGAGPLRAAPAGEGVLEVAAGAVTGTLADAPAGDGPRDTLLWQSPLFAAPFEFPLEQVVRASFPVPLVPPAADALRLHLRGGDVLTGRIDHLDATTLTFDVTGGFGQPLRIDRAEIESIAQAGAGGGSFTGPGGLVGWSESPPGSWREEAGRILSNRRSASVSRDVAAPPRARFDLTLSCKTAAEFRIAIGAAETAAADAYVLELLRPADEDPGMVIQRRERGAAAIRPLTLGPRPGGTLRVVVFVDQSRGRLAAVVPGGDAKATEVELPVPKGRPASGIFRLTLTSGDVCLESLRVTPWQAEEPTLDELPETVVVTGTARMRGVVVESFDPVAAAFVVRGPAGTVRVPAAEVREILLPPAGPLAEPPLAMRVVMRDGGVVSGELLAVDARAVSLVRRGVLNGPIAVPRDAIVAIRGQRAAAVAAEPPGRVGLLVAPPAGEPGGDGTSAIRGCVVAGSDAAGLAWQPLGSLRGSGFATDGPRAAVVEYVSRSRGQLSTEVEVGGIGGMVNLDPAGFFVVVMMTEDGAAARDGRMRPGDRIVAIRPEVGARFVPTRDLDNEQVMNLLRGRVGTPVALQLAAHDGGDPREIELERRAISVAGRHLLEQALATHEALGGPTGPAADAMKPFAAVVVLRSGDVAPCRVLGIDAAGVDLEMPLAGAAPVRVKVAAELVQAVELVPSARSREIDEVLFNRLLTLPRMQRARPPTHLLRLTDGDYLRGRLESLDDAGVRFEVLGARKELPRAAVARVIWLHPETDAAPVPAPDDGLLVQGVSADGSRVTLEAEAVQGATIRGRSRAFGTGTIDIDRIDRLLVGAAVGTDEQARPYGQWKLRPAAEPRALDAGGKPPREDAAADDEGDAG